MPLVDWEELQVEANEGNFRTLSKGFIIVSEQFPTNLRKDTEVH